MVTPRHTVEHHRMKDPRHKLEFLDESGADKLRPILDAARPLMDFVFDASSALTRPPGTDKSN